MIVQRITFVLACITPLVLCVCESYGIDFQNGGTYFQNSLSTDPFTALEEFEGCQNDTAHNVFVDPQGDQSECSETALTPDDVPQLITCSQWPKNQLYTGEWSLIVVSNNGNGDPIAYQRDFSLIVGPQQTLTAATPTITGGSAGTTTIIPPPASTVITKGILEFTDSVRLTVTASTTTVVPASCSTTPTSSIKDPLASLIPSVLGELNAVASSVINGGRKRSEPTPLPALAKFKRELLEGRTVNEETKAAFVEARRAALKLAKRAPDAPTITVTPQPVYVTSTVTAESTTVTQTLYVLFHITTISTTVTTT
ncbi:hypothetical protein AMS68_002011 [Peltaster fructicola]|uniref:Uncharacterized protein n=1 Tax=Peltaster fructicola TaxID=286661 RepID=A0A6H0XP42_9PEZI|nr:hypothetical protein AMS68_002011 [Peltaster fructicola]